MAVSASWARAALITAAQFVNPCTVWLRASPVAAAAAACQSQGPDSRLQPDMAAGGNEVVLERLQGNLIRTPEGKICILDFGLMTEVTPEQSIALVEYISHLSVEDWDAVAVDLRKLGFIPPGEPQRSEIIHDVYDLPEASTGSLSAESCRAHQSVKRWNAVASQMHRLGMIPQGACEGLGARLQRCQQSVQEAGVLGGQPALGGAGPWKATRSSKRGIF